MDGYFRNEAIKILLPDKIKSVEKGLRLFGYGEEIDQFILSKNWLKRKGRSERIQQPA